MNISRRKWMGAAAAEAGISAAALAQPPGPPPAPVRLEPGVVKIEIDGANRVVVSNGLPDHAIGDFPNRHDPVPIRAQEIRLRMPVKPAPAAKPRPLEMWLFGVAVNGVPFDPSGPFW